MPPEPAAASLRYLLERAAPERDKVADTPPPAPCPSPPLAHPPPKCCSTPPPESPFAPKPSPDPASTQSKEKSPLPSSPTPPRATGSTTTCPRPSASPRQYRALPASCEQSAPVGDETNCTPNTASGG